MNLDKLKRILLSNDPSNQIKQHEEELFSYIPELKKCKGFDQHTDWHVYDVYEHTLHVIDNVPNDFTLRIAALFHDLGKPDSFTLDDNGIGHFYGHWQESLNIFKKFAEENKLDKELTDKVSILIFYHDISLDKLDDDALQNIGINNIESLYQLKRADKLSQNPKYHYLLSEYDEQEKRAIERLNKINQNRLKEILLSENIKDSINKNIDYLLSILPELKDMIGFPHNHPHHNLDVWEHTLEALSHSNNELDIRLALLLHDIGKPHSYQDEEVRHFRGHAEVSTKMSIEILKRLGYDDDFIKEIEYLIKNHDIKVTPEEIKDGDIELLTKRLHIQECDAKAHHPNYQQKRLDIINKLRKDLKK